MNLFTVIEIKKFFHSYGVKCDEKVIEEWVNSHPAREELGEAVSEGDLYTYNEWCRWKGTAYEEGIDDKTKIAKLLIEIDELKCELEEEKREKITLENRIGILPF